MKYLIKIREIKYKLDSGLIDYKIAKSLLEPVISGLNEESKKIAKKYGVKPKLFTVSGLLR